MGNIMVIEDLDKLFKTSKFKIVVNEFEPEDRIKHFTLLETLLLQEIESALTFTPRCLCGYLRQGWRIDRTCKRCGSKVSRSNNETLEPTTWFKTKEKGVKFISPGIYAFIDKKVVGNRTRDPDKEREDNPCDGYKFSVLKYLSTPSVRKSKNIGVSDRRIIDIVTKTKGFKRDFRYFSKNFFKICRLVAEIKGGKPGKEILEYINMIETRGTNVYSNYIPVINGKLVYKTTSDSKITPTYNMVKNMVLGYIDKNNTEEDSLNAMALVNYKSSCLYTAHVRDIVSSKLGVGRKHGLASKLDFSGRCVCIPSISINNIHEVHMPYVTSIVLFRLHIANILLKTHSARETHRIIRNAKVNFSQEVYSILKSLITESRLKLSNGKPYQGIIVGRNPGLLVGSILRLCLTHVKSDINDDTMEVSTALAKLPNYDFDGDLLYFSLPLSNYVYDLFEPLSPYASVNSPKVPGAVYGKINIGPVAPGNIANMLYRERKKYT